MKILHVISIGRVAGGAEKNTFIVNDLHRELGYEVRTLSSDVDKDKQLLSEYTFSAIKKEERTKYIRHIFNVQAYKELRRLLKEWDPDIVHLHTMGQVSPLPLFLLKHYKTVMHLHGPEVFIPALLPWCIHKSLYTSDARNWSSLTPIGKLYFLYYRYLAYPVYRLGLRNVNLFIAPSKYIAKISKTTLSPIVHLPSGIFMKEYCRYPKNGTILSVGRIEKVKGLDYLLHAMKEVIVEFPKAKLIIIGKGPFEAELRQLAKDLGITKNVVFPGWVDQSEVYEYYKNCRIFVLPSVWPENFPTVCNEALSAGRPVVATRVGGIGEIVEHRKSGLLVPPQNSSALAKAMINLYDNRKLAEQMGKNGYESVKKFEFHLHAQKLTDIYEQVSKGKYGH
jgi:glycosyltransferase involved in cell wall biosynthesis